MCELPPKEPNIENKAKQFFLTPTASKKSQICEIWHQKSQSDNPDHHMLPTSHNACHVFLVKQQSCLLPCHAHYT